MEVIQDQFRHFYATASDSVDAALQDHRPHQIVLLVTSSVLLFCYAYSTLFNKYCIFPLRHRLTHKAVRWSLRLPFIGSIIKKELDAARADMRTAVQFKPKTVEQLPKTITEYQNKISQKSQDPSKVLETLTSLKSTYDKDLSSARCGNLQVYYNDTAVKELQHETYRLYASTNMLHADHFLAARKLEAEVCRQVLTLYNGNSDTAGIHSTGGTESILLCMLAYRNYWQDQTSFDGSYPELVLCRTAHPAFHRAAHYFGMKLVIVEADSKSQKFLAKSVEKSITNRTVCVVASAPQYPHGIYDEVEEIAEVCRRYDVMMHVDACLGGFINPFATDAGFKIPILDFRLPAVHTISADSHKYGCTPKGSSLAMFRSEKLRSYAAHATMTWPGGAYLSSTLAGARSGSSSAITWATMQAIGYDGYVERTRGILTLAQKLSKAAQKAPGLDVFPTECQTVAFTSKKYNIFKVFDEMNKLGWSLQALQHPPAIHMGVTYFHVLKDAEFVQEFESDLVRVCTALHNDPSQALEEGSQAATISYLYGMSTAIKDSTAIEDVAKEYVNAYYSTE